MSAASDMPQPAGSRWVLLLRVVASVLILAALLWFVRNEDLVGRFAGMQPGYALAGVAALAGVIFCNSVRWQMLLRGYGVRARLGEALLLYNVSLFFALFLPGSVGGDAVRSYYIARRHGRLAVVLLATVQERLAGLGALLIPGIVGVLLLRAQLGVALAGTLLLIQVGTLALVLVALFPAPLIALGRRLWRMFGQRIPAALLQRVGAERAWRFLQPATEPLRLEAGQLLLLLVAMCGSTLFGVGTYWLLALALGVQVSWLAIAVASAVVTLARTLPISLNGIGVGEGAFVVMLAPFGVASASALALSLAGLGAHTLAGLIGGICYALLLGRGGMPKLAEEHPA